MISNNYDLSPSAGLVLDGLHELITRGYISFYVYNPDTYEEIDKYAISVKIEGEYIEALQQ